jgi:hypothetical protein
MEDTTLEHPEAVRSVSVIGPYAVTGCRDEHVRVFDIAVSLTEGGIEQLTAMANCVDKPSSRVNWWQFWRDISMR